MERGMGGGVGGGIGGMGGMGMGGMGMGMGGMGGMPFPMQGRTFQVTLRNGTASVTSGEGAMPPPEVRLPYCQYCHLSLLPPPSYFYLLPSLFLHSLSLSLYALPLPPLPPTLR